MSTSTIAELTAPEIAADDPRRAQHEYLHPAEPHDFDRRGEAEIRWCVAAAEYAQAGKVREAAQARLIATRHARARYHAAAARKTAEARELLRPFMQLTGLETVPGHFLTVGSLHTLWWRWEQMVRSIAQQEQILGREHYEGLEDPGGYAYDRGEEG
jgi:hypothetical protein